MDILPLFDGPKLGCSSQLININEFVVLHIGDIVDPILPESLCPLVLTISPVLAVHRCIMDKLRFPSRNTFSLTLFVVEEEQNDLEANEEDEGDEDSHDS